MDSKLARKGHIEGPVMSVHVRSETKFRDDGEEKGCGRSEVLDFYREVGSCLLLAQKRGREGKNEIPFGRGKWWGEKKRCQGWEYAL